MTNKYFAQSSMQNFEGVGNYRNGANGPNSANVQPLETNGALWTASD